MPGTDLKTALGSDDTIYALGDSDKINAGSGEFRSYTGDMVLHQRGVNALRARAGKDRILGNAVEDSIITEDGSDFDEGGLGNDLVLSGLAC